MEVSMKKLGANIRMVREEKGMAIEELAEKMGATEDYVRKAEAGKRLIRLQALMTFCLALDVSPNVLLKDIVEDN